MGDVALLVPVVRAVTEHHPDVEITVATRPRFAAFFAHILRVNVFEADLDRDYKGLTGLYRLYRNLKRLRRFDAVIDEHDHLRTKIVRTFFRLTATRVVVFDKGRDAKRAFSRKHNKVRHKLPHTVERYRAAFLKAGVSFDLLPPPFFNVSESIQQEVAVWLKERNLNHDRPWIGLAPFAMHKTKIWLPENYSELIRQISQRVKAHFFLFGGGPKEQAFFETLSVGFPDITTTVAGQLKLRHEIALIGELDTMVCVDSSNMHLAALAGIPVVSIWGGTHPDVGFAPWSNRASILQIPSEELPCRPCSVYGRESCYVGGFPCLTRITVGQVAETVVATVLKHDQPD